MKDSSRFVNGGVIMLLFISWGRCCSNDDVDVIYTVVVVVDDVEVAVQVLRTYEGRRLHEKLQHVAKMNMELAPQMEAEEGRWWPCPCWCWCWCWWTLRRKGDVHVDVDIQGKGRVNNVVIQVHGDVDNSDNDGAVDSCGAQDSQNQSLDFCFKGLEANPSRPLEGRRSRPKHSRRVQRRRESRTWKGRGASSF